MHPSEFIDDSAQKFISFEFGLASSLLYTIGIKELSE
jgi:hypothetical protein